MRRPIARWGELLLAFMSAWFKVRDQRTVLGALWSFLNPLIMALILYLLFRGRMRASDQNGYFLYILIGTVVWNFFSSGVQMSLSVLTRQGNMVRNCVFPKALLVFSQVGVYLVQHVSEIGVVLLFAFFLGGVSWQVIALPLIVFMTVLLIAGLGLVLSCLCVYTRDIEYIWQVASRMLFFLVPVFYSPQELSPYFRALVNTNPLTWLIGFYRDILLEGRLPAGGAVVLAGALCLCCFSAGLRFFIRCEPTLVERV